MYLYILSSIVTLLLVLVLIPFLRKFAFTIQLVDKPNYRKVHNDSIPLVGGIAVFVSTSMSLISIAFFDSELKALGSLFAGMTLLLFMGVVDDKKDLRASLKLGIQILLAHFVFMQGVKIESMYGIFGIYELAEWAQYLLTIVVITGVINAFNLMDGIDGLAAGLAIVGLIVFIFLAVMSKQNTLALIFSTYIGALIGFLRFNFSKERKIFMGDAGSLIMGYLLVVSAIKLLQSAQNLPAAPSVKIGVIAILIVPVFDALRVFRRRMKSGKSPFDADKTHLHHLILSLGLKHKLATALIIVLVTLIIAIGFWVHYTTGITFAIVSMLLLFSLITSLLQFHNTLNMWKTKIREMESSWN